MKTRQGEERVRPPGHLSPLQYVRKRSDVRGKTQAAIHEVIPPSPNKRGLQHTRGIATIVARKEQLVTMPDPRTYIDMALPLVKTLPECADYYKTVEPFIPQFYDLPTKVAAHITDMQALKELYLNTNPLISSLAFATMFLTPVVLALSEFNRNYSQVDRLWSLLPAFYNIHYAVWAHLNGLPTMKLDHVMAVSIIWSARLTFNYWRKGGYEVGSEDYRWITVKDYIGGPAMFVFNVIFISLYQNVSKRALCIGRGRVADSCRFSFGQSPHPLMSYFLPRVLVAMTLPRTIP